MLNLETEAIIQGAGPLGEFGGYRVAPVPSTR